MKQFRRMVHLQPCEVLVCRQVAEPAEQSAEVSFVDKSFFSHMFDRIKIHVIVLYVLKAGLIGIKSAGAL